MLNTTITFKDGTVRKLMLETDARKAIITVIENMGDRVIINAKDGTMVLFFHDVRSIDFF